MCVYATIADSVIPAILYRNTQCSLQSLINIPGKAAATLCASHVYVTLEAIIHDSSVSDSAIPASDQLETAKQICKAIIAVLNVLRHGMQPISLHA